MTIKVKVDTTGIDQIQQRMSNASKRLKQDLTPALAPAAAELEGEIKKSIAAERGMNGERWPKKKTPGKAIQGVADDVHATAKGNAIPFGVSGPGVYHQFGKPPRRFLPTDAKGTPLFSKGAAKKWLKRTQERVVRYILTGNTR